MSSYVIPEAATFTQDGKALLGRTGDTQRERYLGIVGYDFEVENYVAERYETVIICDVEELGPDAELDAQQAYVIYDHAGKGRLVLGSEVANEELDLEYKSHKIYALTLPPEPEEEVDSED